MEWEKEGVHFLTAGGELGHCTDEDAGARDGTGLVSLHLTAGDVCGLRLRFARFPRGQPLGEGRPPGRESSLCADPKESPGGGRALPLTWGKRRFWAFIPPPMIQGPGLLR